MSGLFSLTLLLVPLTVVSLAPHLPDAPFLAARAPQFAIPSSLDARTRAASSTNTSWPTVNIDVIALGGDPTGQLDSSDALDAAVAAAAAAQNASADDWSLGSHRVTIDLSGGVFALSRPVLLHGRGASAVTLAGGALVALPTFPHDGFLVDIGGWAEGVTLRDLTLDARHVCGGVRVNGAEQTNLARVFVVHYATVGIFGDDAAGQSNELLVVDSVVAEFQWGERGFNETALQSGTGIVIRFCDSHFINVIVRCTKVGVVDDGGGNLYLGAHIYATCNKDPSGANVAPAMVLSGEAYRVIGCNFDDSPVILRSVVDILMSDNVFYGLSGLTIAPQARAAITYARGVLVTGNTFRGTAYAPSPTITYDTRNGTLDVSSLNSVHVADNSFSNASVSRSTRVAVTLAVSVPRAQQPPCTTFATIVDLTSSLLFVPDAGDCELSNNGPGAGGHPRSAAAPSGNAAFLGLTLVSSTFSLTAPAPGDFPVHNVAPTSRFGVLSVTAAAVYVGAAAECAAVEGVLTLVVDQRSALGS